MARRWNEFVAALGQFLPLPLLVLVLLTLAAVAAALWYWFPAWVPRRAPRLPRLRRPRWRLRLRWPRWRAPRWRRPAPGLPGRWWRAFTGWLRALLAWLRPPWRHRPAADPEPAAPPPVEEPPPPPVAELVGLADRLAAEGRYAEALRERLRAVVGQLVERGVIGHVPGLTVTELTAAAATARPALAAPLHAAAGLFSEVWYGQRPATAAHDERMRGLADEVRRSLEPVGSAPAGGAL